MIVSIMQPCYLPWLGYFDRLARSDLHIVLDHVQIGNGSDNFANRNRIRTATGSAWLTVPVLTRGQAQPELNVVRIDSSRPWQRKHWNSLRSAYGGSRYFRTYAPRLEPLYQRPYETLAEVVTLSTDVLRTAIGIDTPTVRSSAMGVQSRKAQLILDLCVSVGATAYLSGPLGRGYLDSDAFDRAGVELRFHDYRHPVYTQAFPGFLPQMSVVDLLFNHGPETLPILRGDRADAAAETVQSLETGS